ncbi:MAG: hypothetical protein V4543_12370 [Bacteroidota bacterium]
MGKCILICICLLGGSSFAYAQAGLYESQGYRFENTSEPSKNKVNGQKNKLILNFSVLDKYIIWIIKGEKAGDDNLIQYKLGRILDTDITGKKVTTIYEGEINYLGAESAGKGMGECKIYKVVNTENNELDICISPSIGTVYCFFNLVFR